MRYKDGKSLPIKMSIWDAFKGVPTPKPRPHRVGLSTRCSHQVLTSPQCNCCDMIHLPSAKPSPADAPTFDNKDRKPGGDAAEADEARKGGSDLTTEEDAKIMEMKVGGKTWKQIVDEVKKPKHVVQARWKEIGPAKTDSKPEEKAENSEDNDEAKLCENNDIEKPKTKLSKKEKKALAAKERQEKKEKRGTEKNEEVPRKPEQEEAKKETRPDVSYLLSLLAQADMRVSQEYQSQ